MHLFTCDQIRGTTFCSLHELHTVYTGELLQCHELYERSLISPRDHTRVAVYVSVGLASFRQSGKEDLA